MRKKILVAVMAVLLCGASMPSAYASAEKMPDMGAWGAFWPGWFNDYNNYYDGNYDYASDNGSSQYNRDDEYGYWTNTNGWISSNDEDDGYWYDVGEWDDGDSDEEDYWTGVNSWISNDYEDDNYYNSRYDNDYNDYDGEEELDIYDIAVNPKKKEIKKGKSFYISIVPADKSEWEGFSEEEWDEICEDNIESIEYTSTKKTVASVNSFNGKVKARKKGTAIIKTTINLVNEESVTFKTKVTVKK